MARNSRIYKYSICYPDNSEIEYPKEILTAEQVKSMVINYPWQDQLRKLKALKWEEISFHPSLDFKHIENKFSFCLTAEGEPEKYSFAIWYNRPVMRKILFGILGEKPRFEVIDKAFSKEESFVLLDLFLEGNYEKIEERMTS